MKCKKCNGTKWYRYDENHKTRCNQCCKHSGWWKLTKGYAGYKRGKNNNCCIDGCGTMQRDCTKTYRNMYISVQEVVRNYTGMKNEFLEGLAHDIGKVMDQYKW